MPVREGLSRRTLVASFVGMALTPSLSGCSSGPSQAQTCMVNADCSNPSNDVCVMGKCQPPATGRVVAFSITPPGSSRAAQTELPDRMLTGQPVTLVLADKATVSATVMSEATFFPREAHVQVTIPSRIPGQTPLQLGTEMANNMFTFSLAQDRIRMDTEASFLFTPGTTAQDRPPVLVPAPLATAIELTFPAKTELIAVNGQIVDSNGTPFTGDGYRAQLSHERRLVSNVIAPDVMGIFRLLVPPKGQLEDINDLVTLTIGTADSPMDEPQFVSSPEISLATLAAETKDRPRVFVMPEHLPATLASLHVTGNGRDQAGVTVRFRTEIDAPAYGKAVYQRTAMTDAQGYAYVPLIPGPVGAPLLYQIALQGPADDTYRYSSRCLPDVPVALDETGALPALAPIALDPKFSLSGSVRDSTEAPVMGARVIATQITPSTACSDPDLLGSNPVSAPTDAMGNYYLYVDPGTYRLEVTPPPSSAWPRMTEDGAGAVTVVHNVVHPIELPAGEAVEGTVMASDGTLLPDSKVSILSAVCQSVPCPAGTETVVLAEATTDAAGYFKAIIPAP